MRYAKPVSFSCLTILETKQGLNILICDIDPPVFWTEVYGEANQKWITIDPVRGVVNSPLKMYPANSCATNNLAYVVAYDEGNIPWH